MAVDYQDGEEDVTVDAVGPEVFEYREMVKLVRDAVGSRCAVIPSPKPVTCLAGRVLGMMLRDIVVTRDEIKGLSRGLLVSKSGEEPPCRTRLTTWLEENAHNLGRSYANEVQRRYR